MKDAKMISKEEIAKMSSEFRKGKTQQVIQKAVMKNGILESGENLDVLKQLSPPDFAFSVDVDSQAVANQLQSGRCWMFACLNVIRWHIEKELGLPHGKFELSQAYLAFYNKLERASWFLRHVIDTADKPLGDREVHWLFSNPMCDGGDWDMIAGLVKKYGVIPHSCMSETYCTNNTAEVNTVLSRILRQDAMKLRSMVNEGKNTDAAVSEMLTEVYRVLAVCFGEPPEKIDFEYMDGKKQYHADRGLTPLEFMKKYVHIDLDNYVGVINVPGEDNPYNRLYAIEDSDQIPERENLYLNVPMPDLKKLVVEMLKAGDPVWFGCDVLQHCDRNAGVMALDLFDLEDMFDVKFELDKAQRFACQESLPTHAMVFAGVDMDGDKCLKWKIENSWGTENHGIKTGNNGYFVCSDDWFDNYVYEVAVRKDLLTPEQQKAFEQDPIVWPFYNTFNPVLTIG